MADPTRFVLRPRLPFREGDGLFELLQPLTDSERRDELVFFLRLGYAVWAGRFQAAVVQPTPVPDPAPASAVSISSPPARGDGDSGQVAGVREFLEGGELKALLTPRVGAAAPAEAAPLPVPVPPEPAQVAGAEPVPAPVPSPTATRRILSWTTILPSGWWPRTGGSHGKD